MESKVNDIESIKDSTGGFDARIVALAAAAGALESPAELLAGVELLACRAGSADTREIATIHHLLCGVLLSFRGQGYGVERLPLPDLRHKDGAGFAASPSEELAGLLPLLQAIQHRETVYAVVDALRDLAQARSRDHSTYGMAGAESWRALRDWLPGTDDSDKPVKGQVNGAKLKTTPGPWRHFPSGYVSDASGDIILEMFHATDKPWREDVDLIAAAPDLHSIVEKVFEGLELALALGRGISQAELALRHDCHRAIAKARGEATK